MTNWQSVLFVKRLELVAKYEQTLQGALVII